MVGVSHYHTGRQVTDRVRLALIP